MNSSFLGDALDHWKGSLFESLQKRRIVCELAVDPMASDLAVWKPDEVWRKPNPEARGDESRRWWE